MNSIAGLPYLEAEFDKDGALRSAVTLPPGITDLLVVSHGWNNSADEARALYRELFENLVAVARPNDLPGRSVAVVGVIWPSKKFDELVAVAAQPGASGAAGLSSDTGSTAALAARLDGLKALFASEREQALIEDAKALLPDLDDKASARRAFADALRSLLDRSAANREDASDTFFKEDGNDLMQSLKVDEDDLAEDAPGPAAGGGALFETGGVPAATGAATGAAGIKEFFSGFKAAAMNLLNFTTYFEMKTRAGTVGAKGLAPLIDTLAPQVDRLHLVGHSFGGRVVTAAAASSHTDRIRSMTLLQAAFSHNGFSKTRDGAFRAVVDQGRVHGPILVTHTKNDKAVGLAYPLASRISGDKRAGFGEADDVFGGIGRNGAQQMGAGETTTGSLQPEGSQYAFTAGTFFNLEASAFIKDHGDVRGRQVAHALRCAIA